MAVHPVFPSWLTERSDFLAYYDELKGLDGMPRVSVVENIVRSAPELRTGSDLAIVCKWIKMHQILSNLRRSRLLEVCRCVCCIVLAVAPLSHRSCLRLSSFCIEIEKCAFKK